MGADRPGAATRRGIAVAALMIGAVVGVAACGDGGDPAARRDEPTTGNGATSSGEPAEGGGLTVTEALDAPERSRPMQVHGYVVAEGDDARLCESLDTLTTPPKCDGASAPLEGFDLDDLDQSSGSTRWSQTEVSVLINRENDAFVIPETAT